MTLEPKPYESLKPEILSLIEDFSKDFEYLGETFTEEERKALSVKTYEMFTFDPSPSTLYTMSSKLDSIIEELYAKSCDNSENFLDKLIFTNKCVVYSDFTGIIFGMEILANEFDKTKNYQTIGRIPFTTGLVLGIIFRHSKEIPELTNYWNKLWEIYQKYESIIETD